MSALRSPGRIVTFYSYKGGTGRSMALANIAWILASQHQRVLVIDWDLEAPGLHRYFQPFIPDPELVASPGIIDFLAAFVEGAHLVKDRDDTRWFERYVDCEPYTFSLDWKFAGTGTLDLIPAGQQGPAYGPRVTDFEWRKFYEVLGGGTFLQAVKARWRAEYDWILIDSRTGISDTSGICTVQMPDDLVVCFTLNNQSIIGASAVAKSVVGQRVKPDGTAGVRVFPVCTRVERAEHVRLTAAMELAAARFGPFLAHLPIEAQKLYFGTAQVHYQPFYALEEVLATFGDPRDGPMLSAMEKLCALVTDGRISRLGEMSEAERVDGLARFLRKTSAPERSQEPLQEPPEPPFVEVISAAVARWPDKIERQPGASRGFSPSATGTQNYTYWFYLSYAHNNWDPYLQRFAADLSQEILGRLKIDTQAIGFSDRGLSSREEWSDEIASAMARSRLCVCMYSPSYFMSEQCGREFNVFSWRRQLASSSQRAPTGIFPVLWMPTEVPALAASIQYLDGSSEEYSRDGLRQMLQRGRRSSYPAWLHRFVDRLCDAGERAPLPILEPPRMLHVPNAFEGYAPRPTERARSVMFVFWAQSASDQSFDRPSSELDGASPRDWRPFAGKTIERIAREVASAEDAFYLEVPTVETSMHALQDLVVRAQTEGTPVILLVDATATLKGRYRLLQLITDLALPHYNFAVVMILNGQKVTSAEYDLAVSSFQATARLQSPRPRDNAILAYVEQEDDLKNQLRQTLAALRVSILSRLTTRALDDRVERMDTEPARPSLQGPDRSEAEKPG